LGRSWSFIEHANQSHLQARGCSTVTCSGERNRRCERSCGPPVNGAGDHYKCMSAPFVNKCGFVNSAGGWIPWPYNIG
jgi:hypothetical protein